MSQRSKPASKRPARPGKLDRAGFEQQIESFRRELRVHCYRMTGSPHDAEDLVQETYLRAWRSLDTFEGRSSLRAWLYRIATNACLNALADRKDQRRLLPDQLLSPSHEAPSGAPPIEIEWLAPYPDSQLVGIADDALGPAARYEARESVQLAFVALIQTLPPRQRAAVLLCDVLGWPANEATSLLGGSLASINSALQRARATLSARYPENRPRNSPIPDHAQRTLLERYVRAWEGADLDGFVSLLKEDATYTMPPWPHWYRGRDSIRTFFSKVWGVHGSFRLVAIGANRQPAFALYSCKPGDQIYRAFCIQLLEIQNDAISALTAYVRPLGPTLFAEFGLPLIATGARR